jgi:hypothetical protein
VSSGVLKALSLATGASLVAAIVTVMFWFETSAPSLARNVRCRSRCIR